MVPFLQSTVRAGTTPIATDFAGHSVERIHIDYDPANPGSVFDPARVRVIVTPNAQRNPNANAQHVVPPVLRIENVTDTGFDISAYNPEANPGFAGFDWLAMEETGREQETSLDLRLGMTQSQVFKPEGQNGDWSAFGVPYSSPFPRRGGIYRLVTASNHGIAIGKTYFYEKVPPAPPAYAEQNDLTPMKLVGNDSHVWRSNIMAVGVTTDEYNTAPNEGLTLIARNVEGVEGKCSFYFVALADRVERGASSDVMVDSGTTPFAIHADSIPSGWHIYFSRPFQEPPVVLATANDRGAPWTAASGDVLHPAHAVVEAHDVTRYGFTLVAWAREPDLARNQIIYSDWVALGCGLGCT